MNKYPKYKNTNIEWLEQIPDHWETSKIKDFAKVLTGATPKTAVEEFWNGKVNWVTTDDLGKLKDKYIVKTRRRITQLGYDSSGVKLAQKKSIILSTRAPIGHLGILDIEACTNQGCKTIEANSNYSSEFVYYVLSISKDYLRAIGVGTTFIELTTLALKTYLIPLPPLQEQKAIADYLDSKTNEIDQIIEAKKKLIDLYNEEKTALINKAVTKGIDDKAKLKPSGVEWLGDIPQHWEVKKLKYVALINQDSLPDSTNKELLINYVEISDVKYGNGIINHTEYRFEDAPSRAKRIVKEGDIIISTVRTYLKSIAVISNPLKNMIVSTGFAVITPVNISSAYLGFIANSNKFVAVIISLSVGVSYPAINPDGIMNINISLPPIKEQEKIVDYIEKNVSVIDKKIENAKRLIELLSEYRTTLISEVVTGKLKVV